MMDKKDFAKQRNFHRKRQSDSFMTGGKTRNSSELMPTSIDHNNSMVLLGDEARIQEGYDKKFSMF